MPLAEDDGNASAASELVGFTACVPEDVGGTLGKPHRDQLFRVAGLAGRAHQQVRHTTQNAELVGVAAKRQNLRRTGYTSVGWNLHAPP